MTSLRVMVVEDDSVIGMLLAELLTHMGHDVCAIESNEAGAVTAAARCKPDLMIVDVSLGEGSGLAAVDKICRAGLVPHLFVSGDIASIRALRPDAVLVQKPFHQTELAWAIESARAESLL